MWTWLLVILGILVGIPLVLSAAGMMIPKAHRATRQAQYRQSAETIWATITDLAQWPAWRPDVKSMERAADLNGHPVWVQVSRMGRMPLEITESTPPRRMVTRIADESLPFGGTWRWELTPVEGGCTLRITEDGEIRNPLFRFMARFIFGYHGTLEAYLKDLGRKFGEQTIPA
jgi:uncharacterized protein YndB with AHSA1/START domain